MIINGESLLKKAPIKDMFGFKHQGPLSSHGLTECGYDIRLAETVTFEPNHSYPNYSYRDMVKVNGVIQPGRFALGSSIEEFDMPSDLMGRVLNKSTWARKGLDASMTTNIEPGWRGILTIELIYHGVADLTLPAGTGICQVIFETLAEPAVYSGKYQDQEAGPQAARFSEPEKKVVMCGGCGATSSRQRCIGCMHDFKDEG